MSEIASFFEENLFVFIGIGVIAFIVAALCVAGYYINKSEKEERKERKWLIYITIYLLVYGELPPIKHKEDF